MKKLTAFILSLVFLLLLAACGNPSQSGPAPSSGSSASGQSGAGSQVSGGATDAQGQTSSAAAEIITWEDHIINESFYDEKTSKDPLINFSATLPLVKNNDVIKAYYEKKAEELRKDAGALLDLAKDDYNWSKTQTNNIFIPFEIETSYGVQRNDGRVFSVTLFTYQNTGGVHPNNLLKADSFDTQTGELITAEDLFTLPLSEALEIIKPAIIAEMDRLSKDEDFDLFYPNARSDLFSLWEKTDFYFSEDALVFVWQTYSLAPHAAGILEFPIPLSDLSEILDARWMLS